MSTSPTLPAPRRSSWPSSNALPRSRSAWSGSRRRTSRARKQRSCGSSTAARRYRSRNRHDRSNRGVGGAPTLISNVETLAHLALLARGVDSTGNLLLTISGTGIEPALVEVGSGTTLRALLTACGWWHATGAMMGGLFGGLADGHILDVPVAVDDLKAAGSALGCGAIHLLSADDCPVDLAVDALAYLAAESARQCGVCISGTAALASTAAGLRTGVATAEDLAKIERWSIGLPGRGACGLLDAAARVAGSLLSQFRAVVDDHLRWRCSTCAASPARGGERLIVDAPVCDQLATR